MIIYVKKSEEPTKKILELMREFRKKTVACQINIQELRAFLYAPRSVF